MFFFLFFFRFLRKVIGEAKERLNEMQILIFHPYTVDEIGRFCRKEATIFEVANSKVIVTVESVRPFDIVYR